MSARKANGQHLQDSPLDFAASGASGGCGCNPNSSLCTQPPTENSIRQGLAGFVFGPGPGTMAEAKSILQFLCAEVQHEYVYPDGTVRVCGVFPTGYEVTLWTPTYGSSDRYGARYGLLSANHSYFGSNATYFELVK